MLFIERARPFLDAADFEWSEEKFRIIAPHVQERVKLLKEIPDMVDFLFIQIIRAIRARICSQTPRL